MSTPNLHMISYVLFSFKGRINRLKFFLGMAFLWFLFSLPAIFIGLLGDNYFEKDNPLGVTLMIFLLMLILISIFCHFPLLIKRAHDLEHSWGFLIVYFIPLIGIWSMLEFLFRKGTSGINKYGPASTEPQV